MPKIGTRGIRISWHRCRSTPTTEYSAPTRFGSPPRPLHPLPPHCEQLIDEWVERAHPHTTVGTNGTPEGFVAVCAPAPGAFTFADTEQEAIDDMRSALFGWAYFSLVDGQALPALPDDTATG